MSPAPKNPDEYERLKAGIAAASGFDLYAQYSEAEAAEFLKIHPQTLKRIRIDGRIEYIRIGPRNILYLGVNIADFLIGSVQWQNQEDPTSGSATTGSPNAPEPTLGAAPGMTQTDSARAAYRLAQQSLKKPSKD